MAKPYHSPTLFWPEIWKTHLRAGLQDDGSVWDWTSLSMKGEVSARIIAKSKGVWAAETLLGSLTAISSELGVPVEAESRLRDGDALKPGLEVATISGDARALLALERPTLNLAAYVSGIATRTAGLAALIRKACPKKTPRLTPTRKTLPGYRDVAILGVRAGGGESHRVSLSGGVLIKENHIRAAGGIAPSIAAARKVAPHGLKIEIEVTSLEELEEALGASAEVVLLDNFKPKQVREALKLVGGRAVVEVSGGLTEDNIAGFALPGVDVLSVGSLTHSVIAVDLSLLVRQ